LRTNPLDVTSSFFPSKTKKGNQNDDKGADKGEIETMWKGKAGKGPNSFFTEPCLGFRRDHGSTDENGKKGGAIAQKTRSLQKIRDGGSDDLRNNQ